MNTIKISTILRYGMLKENKEKLSKKQNKFHNQKQKKDKMKIRQKIKNIRRKLMIQAKDSINMAT